MDQPTIVTRDEWLVARKGLLLKEKALTHAKDALSTERRRLPMVRSTSSTCSTLPRAARRWAICSQAGASS
jgi:predicted dithiol-disulfide oxidoreductase (DUF899 family)